MSFDKNEFDNVVSQLSGDQLESMREAFEWVISCDHVIVDDAFDDANCTFLADVSYQVLLIGLAIARSIDPGKILFATIDPIMGDGSHKQSTVDALLGNHSNEKLYAVNILQKVMRCSANVFDCAYNEVMPTSWNFDQHC